MKNKPKNSGKVRHAGETVSSHMPLKGQSIYLDLTHRKNSAEIERKLKLLGATVERCFSRDVANVLTDRDATAIDRCLEGAGLLKTSVAGRLNGHSVSPSSVPSPASRNLFDVVQKNSALSPLCQSSPAYSPNMQDAICRPVTRGQAIAFKANLTRNYGSTNVLQNAKEWGIRVISIQKAERWLEKEMKKLPGKTKVKESKPNVHKLSDPYIKVEDQLRRYRPQFQRMTYVPTFRAHGVLGVGIFEKSVSSQKAAALPLDVEALSSTKAKRADGNCGAFSPSLKRIAEKAHVEPEPAIKYGHKYAQRLRNNKIKNKSQYGFCEICDMNYDDLAMHCKSDQHQTKSRESTLFMNLDSVINDGLSMKSLHHSVVQSAVSPSPMRRGRIDVCDMNFGSPKTSSPLSTVRPSTSYSRLRVSSRLAVKSAKFSGKETLEECVKRQLIDEGLEQESACDGVL